jgi:glycosyltransferase involved in cell wall biosynthesis
VSVIVASYNYRAFLPRRLDSLIAQTYKNLEIIVIDDASTDGSLDILANYESNPIIRIYKNKNNLGWVGTSNLGAEFAKGDFIIFANCDDYCYSTMIEVLALPLVNSSDVALSFCCSNLIDESGNIIGNDRKFRERSFLRKCSHDALLLSDEMLYFLCKSCVIPNLSATLIRRSAFFDAGGFSHNFEVCSDWDLYMKIVNISPVFYIRQPLNYFRQHSNTIRSSTRDRKVYSEYITLTIQLVLSCSRAKTRFRGRLRVAYYIGSYLLRPSREGVAFFFEQLSYLRNTDPVSLLFIPGGVLLRACYLGAIIFNKASRRWIRSQSDL